MQAPISLILMALIDYRKLMKSNNFQELIEDQSNQNHSQFELNASGIGPEVYKQMIQRDWKHLKNLDLSENNIGIQGCDYLSNTQWHALQYLFLGRNNIDDQGYKSIDKGEWLLLQQLHLQNNKITVLLTSSHHSLSKKFLNLKVMRLSCNLIESIESLSWLHAPSLQIIYLDNNRIATINPIVKVNSRSLKIITLCNNYIKEIWSLQHMIMKIEWLQFSYGNSFSEKNISIKSLVKYNFESSNGVDIYINTAFEGPAKQSLLKKQKIRIFD